MPGKIWMETDGAGLPARSRALIVRAASAEGGNIDKHRSKIEIEKGKTAVGGKRGNLRVIIGKSSCASGCV
jgi:hypothetical protein